MSHVGITTLSNHERFKYAYTPRVKGKMLVYLVMLDTPAIDI